MPELSEVAATRHDVEPCGCQDDALTRGQALDLGGRLEHGQQVLTNSTDHKGDAELSPVAVVTPRVRLHCVSAHVVAIDDSDEPLLHS